jgi:hypothetical protein
MSKYPELTSLNRGYNDDSGMVYKYRNGNIQYEGLLDFRNTPVQDTYVNPKNVSQVLSDMQDKKTVEKPEKCVLYVDLEKLKLQGGVPPNAIQAIMQAVNQEVTPAKSAASNVAKINKEVYKDPKKSKKMVKLM